MVKYSNVDKSFSALSEPIRRKILKLVLDDTLNLAELASENKISLPAVSKHLKVLENSNLLKRERKGRNYKFSLTEIAKFWVKKFDDLEKFLKE